MSFIRVPHDLPSHPAVLALAAELGSDALAVGATVGLLLWADKHGPGGGRLPTLEPKTLARAAGLKDAAPLLRSGLVDDKGRMAMWETTIGPVAKAREDGRVRAAASRALAPRPPEKACPGFERWWKDFTAPGPWGAHLVERYRGRGSKAAAQKVWVRLGLEGNAALVEEITKAMHRQRAEICSLARQGKFVARWQDGQRWLGHKRWEDDPLTQGDLPPLPPEYEPEEVNVDPFLDGLPT